MAPEASRSAQAPFKCSQDEAWAVHFAELKAWCATHERLPRRSSPIGPERSLADFVGSQRRAASQGRLKEERRRMLATIPGVLMTASYSQVRQAAWEKQVAELRTWHSDHGRMPRQSTPGKENGLARFLSTQRSLATKGQLLEVRRQILSTIPGALDSSSKQGHSQALQAQWDNNFAKLQAWYAEHGALPKERSGTELYVARFIIRQRRANANGKLSEQRREKLQTIPGVITPAPKKSPEWGHHWNDRVESFARWVEAGNVVPASSKTKTEDPIAAWALHQIGKIDSGLMPLDRRARFMQAAHPRSQKAERKAKKAFSTNLPESLLDEAKAIVVANYASQGGYRSLTEFVERAVAAEVQRAQILLNDGLPYSRGEADAIPLRVGRPLAA